LLIFFLNFRYVLLLILICFIFFVAGFPVACRRWFHDFFSFSFIFCWPLD
jgi:hypothetical protein